VVRAFNEMIIKMLIIEPLMRSIRALMGSSGIFGSIATLLGMGGDVGGKVGGTVGGNVGADVGVSVPHSGGVIGRDTFPKRYVHPAYFDDAKRYHLGSDEVPAILQKGEKVIPRGGSSGLVVHVAGSTVIVQGDASEKTLALINQANAQRDRAQPAIIVRTVREAMSRKSL
jgi:hypothetical protein